ncbi:MAG: ABC transporter ATP-binding protein [Bacteroidales bacterium]|nr:ABC transporter ATP-binding protein [Bacteroidales bacterium]
MSYQSDSTELLEINDLCVDFCSEGSWRNVVDHVSYTLMRGRTLGIVGESGSGKSVSSMALMGLLPSNARVSGTARFHAAEGKDVDLLRLPEKELRTYRGSRISMVFQEPMTSLNPVRRCGAQVVEMLRLHEDIGNDEARERVIELFKEVLLPRPEKIFDSYPHEISGGQKQRVMIAMALVCHPDIVIADEPTTALDVTVQKTILELLRQLQQRHNIGVIFISHDLGVIAQIADDVAVMYHGRIVEQGPVGQILHHPQHPYTQGLLACRPPLEGRPLHLPTVAEFMQRQEDAPSEPSAPQTPAAPVPADTPSAVPLLQVRDLEVAYTLKKSVFGRPLQQLMAVDHVSFDVMQGETLGLVGESGCGKTTLGRTLLHLVDAASGSIVYKGQRLDQLTQRQMRTLRPKMQIIFQDPYSSLNPRITIGDAILEPLQVYGKKGGKDRVVELMEQVGLEADWYERYPHELSGGQRQRVCIARALILDPELVVCDESVSALDVSVQAQVLNLLNDLKRSYGYTYIFISHDLSVVRFLSDRIMVMRQGRIVESGPADELYRNPQQEYTRMLIDAIPRV